jgi:serine/threonine protein phosphatase PrpC
MMRASDRLARQVVSGPMPGHCTGGSGVVRPAAGKPARSLVPPTMNYEFCTRTDPGLTRENNEDSVAVDEATRLGILADGMGGYNAGEVASGMATTFIRSELGRWLAQAGRQANAREVRRAMEICVDNANRSIFNAANSNPQYSGMGTTLVLGVFQDDRVMLGHIGDSRCYRLRAGQLEQITKDHSLLQEQLDAGLITREQAATSSNKNLVTRALGVEDAVLLEVNEHRVEAGDLYLMCSDGLSDMLADDAIAGILTEEGNLEQKCIHLVDAANGNGGRDNISVLLAQAIAGSRKKGLISRWLGQ